MFLPRRYKQQYNLFINWTYHVLGKKKYRAFLLHFLCLYSIKVTFINHIYIYMIKIKTPNQSICKDTNLWTVNIHRCYLLKIVFSDGQPIRSTSFREKSG